MPSHYSYCRHHCSMCSVHVLTMSAVQDTININACKAGFKQSAECRMQEQRVKINLEECWDRQLKTSVPFLVWVVSPKGAFTPSSHQILDWNKQNDIRGWGGDLRWVFVENIWVFLNSPRSVPKCLEPHVPPRFKSRKSFSAPPLNLLFVQIKVWEAQTFTKCFKRYSFFMWLLQICVMMSWCKHMASKSCSTPKDIVLMFGTWTFYNKWYVFCVMYAWIYGRGFYYYGSIFSIR